MIKKTEAGTFVVDWREPDGRRRMKRFKKQREAREYHNKVRAAVDAGTYTPETKVSFEEVADLWFSKKSPAAYRSSSLKQWKNHVENYLKPAFGSIVINKISTRMIETASDEWGKRVQAVTVNKVLTTAEAIFKLAEKYRFISKNPVTLADRKKTSTPQGFTRTRVRPDEVYSTNELARLIEAADADKIDRPLIMTAALTGLRHGELLALRWLDLDLKKGILTVRRSLSERGERAAPIFNAPKTKSGLREIPIAEELLSELRRWKVKAPPSSFDLAFPQANGSPLHRRTVAKSILGKTMRKAGLRALSMHQLRHTFASLLLADNTPVAEVAAYLGHSSPVVTWTVYAHWIKTTRTEAVSRFSKAVFGDRCRCNSHHERTGEHVEDCPAKGNENLSSVFPGRHAL